MLDLVENPEDRFSHNEAHICINYVSVQANMMFGPLSKFSKM